MLLRDATIGRATAKRERARKPYVTENQNPTETLAKRPKTEQLLNMQNRQNTTTTRTWKSNQRSQKPTHATLSR